jgi:hypothetical protein
VCVAPIAAFGCSPAPLTREEAVTILSKSPALRGVEYLEIVTPRGCFTADRTTPLDRINPRTERAVFTGHGQEALQREVDLDLVEFALAERPLREPTPLDGCESLWLSSRNGANREIAAFLKAIAWRTFLSDRAVAAGLRVGQPILYRQQTLIAIDAVSPKDDGMTVVTYTWRWEPNQNGAHLGIGASPPAVDAATFIRSNGRWQLRTR